MKIDGLWSYSERSQGARKICERLDIPMHSREEQPHANDKVVINWGCDSLPQAVRKRKVLNPPDKIDEVRNKLNFYSIMQEAGVKVPPFTASQALAQRWAANGATVVARLELDNQAGRGMEIVKPGGEVPYAKVYTKFLPYENEYRVHFVNGKQVYCIRKLRPNEWFDKPLADRDWGDFLWSIRRCNPEAKLLAVAKECFLNTGYDFGAVDMYTDEDGEVYALECNSAPGLLTHEADAYTEALIAA